MKAQSENGISLKINSFRYGNAAQSENGSQDTTADNNSSICSFYFFLLLILFFQLPNELSFDSC